MYKLITLVSFLLNHCAESATYDQRQSGKVNVQVDLNDLQIIALLKGEKEEYVDYDYVYDYSEMTIKPPKPSGKPPKPLNVTVAVTEITKDNITTPTTVLTEQSTEPVIKNTIVHLETTEITINTTLAETTTLKTIEETTVTPQNLGSTIKSNLTTSTPATTSNPATTSTPANNCKKGFVQNSKGNCELKLQATSNALLKILKLSQKLKLRRGNRGEADST